MAMRLHHSIRMVRLAWSTPTSHDRIIAMHIAQVAPLYEPVPPVSYGGQALACGTPVIARGCGSVPEVIVPGRTGWIGDTLEDLVAATRRLDQLDRAECRREAETRFSVQRMADGYEAIYKRLAAGHDAR